MADAAMNGPGLFVSSVRLFRPSPRLVLPAGKGRKMRSNDYPCIETKILPREKRNQIKFVFVAGDDNKCSKYAGAEEGNRIPSSYVVRAGDTDPLSGEVITQKMIAAYYKEADRQIRRNLRFERPEFTEKEQGERRRVMKEFMRSSREEHGRLPSKSVVKQFMDEKEGNRWNTPLSALVEKEGEDCTDREERLSLPPAEMHVGELSVEMQAIADVVASLDERETDVWKVMFMKIVGGKAKPRLKEVADKWDLTPGAITKIRKKIKWMMLKRAEELRAQEH